MIVGMASKRIGDPAFVQLSEVIALPDIVETADLDHEMMQRAATRSHHGEAVVPAIDVEEVETVRLQPEIRDLEAQQVTIERQQALDILDIEDGVPHPKCAGAKAGDRTSGPERIGCESRLAEHFERIAGGITERDQVADMSLVGQRRRPARDFDAGIVKPA
jgi:hypothetical protein